MKQMLFLVSTDEIRAKYLRLLYSCEMGDVDVCQDINLPADVTVINSL
jgi:hypothetical protein